MKQKMEAALTDVRRAYRLVHTYQKNAFHTVNRIKGLFDTEFYWWTPVYSGPPPQRGTYLENRWVWDMLPMYVVSFMFKKAGSDSEEHQAGDWLLDITLDADAGNGWKVLAKAGDPNPAKFNPVEECRSELRMHLSFCKEPCKVNWYYGFWNQIEYTNQELQTLDKFPISIVRKSVDLAELYNEDQILGFVAEYKDLLRVHFPDEAWG